MGFLILIERTFVGHSPTLAARYRLDVRAIFYLNRRVAAGNRVASLTGVGASAHNGAVAFTTTQWSVVLDAQGQSPSAQEALEKLLVRERADLEPADALSADRIYERRWALTLLEQVLARLEDEYRVARNSALFEQLKQMLSDEPDRPSQARIAEELSMTENAVKQAFYRLRQRYRLLLREEIAQTVAAPGDVEEELRHFIAVLQT